MTSPRIKSPNIFTRDHQIISKHPSRIPVLISRTKASPIINATNAVAATASITTINSISTNSSPKKSVTVTLLPLPATRRSSITLDKKLSGILKNTNASPPQKTSTPQHGNNKNGVSTVPDLIRNVPKQKTTSHNRSLRTVEKWLPDIKSAHHENTLESEIHFNKSDSFSDTSSSVVSYSSPSGELSINSATEDTRLSSTTSGYESDDATLRTKISENSNKFIRSKISKNKSKQNPANPWINFNGLNFQNIDILTEKEISTLNARLERLFDVYKKMERTRSNKIQGCPEKSNKNNRLDKYSHVKAKVQSNAPRSVKKSPIVGCKIKHNFASPESQIFKKQRFKNFLKKEPLNHFKSLKSCFRGSEVNKSQTQQDRISKQIVDLPKNSSPRNYHHSKYPRTNDVINKRSKISSDDGSSTIMRDTDLMKMKLTRSDLKSNKRFVVDDSPRVESPTPMPQETVTRMMATFKCPRIKQKSSETSIDRKSIYVNLSSPECRKDSYSRTKNKNLNDQNSQRSNPIFLTMRLPKRLSRPELEQVRRSSSRSLAGHGLLGNSMLVEKCKEIIDIELKRSRDSEIDVKNYYAKTKSLRTPSLEIKSNTQTACFPTSTSLSGIHITRQSYSKQIPNRNEMMVHGSILRNITHTSNRSEKRNKLPETMFNIITTV